MEGPQTNANNAYVCATCSISNSIRGCLQASYNSNNGYIPFASDAMSVVFPEAGEALQPFDTGFGLVEHSVCLPGGLLLH